MRADLKNRIELAMRCMVVAGGDRLVLVETGIGSKFGPERMEIFGVSHERDDLVGSLHKLGFSTEDVTDVHPHASSFRPRGRRQP